MLLHKRRLIQSLCGGLALCLLLSIFGIYGQAAEVRDKVVRLHILAHSDSTDDQHLKMLVRDAVTTAAAQYAPDTGAENALAAVEETLPRLEEAARQTVRQAGYDYPVTVALRRLYFTTRQYDAVTLPAGMYDAVQITIGEGAGQNWWCVVYPPLCTGAATDLSQVLGDDSREWVEQPQRYVIRFKLVEWVESFLQLFR